MLDASTHPVGASLGGGPENPELSTHLGFRDDEHEPWEE
jgi:hypothetical protein